MGCVTPISSSSLRALRSRTVSAAARLRQSPDQALIGALVQRSGADRVDQHRHAPLLSQRDLTEVELDLGVEDDPAAPQDEQVEPLDVGQDLTARQVTHRDGALDLMPGLGIGGIAREDRDLHRQ